MKIVTTNDMKWDKTRNVLHYEILGHFPTNIKVVSAHTGVEIVFKYDGEAAIAADFWDGEMAEYYNDVNGIRLVVTHYLDK